MKIGRLNKNNLRTILIYKQNTADSKSKKPVLIHSHVNVIKSFLFLYIIFPVCVYASLSGGKKESKEKDDDY